MAGVGAAVDLQDGRDGRGGAAQLVHDFGDQASFALVTKGDADIGDELAGKRKERHGKPPKERLLAVRFNAQLSALRLRLDLHHVVRGGLFLAGGRDADVACFLAQFGERFCAKVTHAALHAAHQSGENVVGGTGDFL